ncbi:GNAT family N-acetyltransferase [Clostridium sp. MCC353]|uniref:GNAT family N-acetyltransferase n=1 Tax=Clostridium sp. MCC353 TaxID=2592646 RepID=UPI001C00B30A|nr:GNAT family N-acetyltransferase [Clostridium sp. MCC353]MBT9777226.1 GNAT family N-acetyltransferase [Clostridium sp. MCC353]
MDIRINITNIQIDTKRLILRPWNENDLDDFYEYASVNGCGEMAGWRHHDSVEISNTILKSFIAEKNVFAVVLKGNDKVIGSIGLHCSWAEDDPKYCNLRLKEIGYVLSKAYWGQGLMAEAVMSVIEFCFTEYKLDAITIKHFSNNNQSKRVIEKCGFKFVGQCVGYSSQLQQNVTHMKYILYR